MPAEKLRDGCVKVCGNCRRKRAAIDKVQAPTELATIDLADLKQWIAELSDWTGMPSLK